MKKILHIAAHLGGGVGRAVSEIIKGMHKFHNTLLLLEEPVTKEYVDICKKNNADIIISSEISNIKKEVSCADLVVLNWWGHPLFVNVLHALNETESRLLLWTHVNGLNFPFLTYDFLNMFPLVMFTSPCSYENKKWTLDQIKSIRRKSSVVYGMGNLQNEGILPKNNYQINKKYKIGYVGTLSFNKLSPSIINICNSVCKYIEDTEFVIYGGYDEIISRNLYHEKIILKGHVNNVGSLLREMDVFCYPLVSEHFGCTENALLEAMMAGLPVVVYNNPPEKSIVEHNKTGFVAENTDEMIKYLLELYEDVDLRTEIGKNAQKSINRNYSCKNNSELFISNVEEVLKTKKKIYDFRPLFGKDAWSYFRYLSKYDESKIDSIISGNSKIKLHNIYYEKSKGSPQHFLNYFPDDIGFNKLIINLGGERNES